MLKFCCPGSIIPAEWLYLDFFYRFRNDNLTLAGFDGAVRSSADPDTLTGMLVDFTQKNLQPTQVSLMLLAEKDQPGGSRYQG